VDGAGEGAAAALVDGDLVGVAGDLEGVEGVAGLLVVVDVADGDGDGFDFDVGGVEGEEDGYGVAAARGAAPGAIRRRPGSGLRG
jgi:hypothetical protein